MGRICSIAGCRSGRYEDVTRRKNLGLRQATLFGIPQRRNALQTWRIATGQMNLSMMDLICEYHFSEESITKEDRTVISDGTVHVLPRQKYALTKTAIPMAITDKENVEPALEAPDSQKELASDLEVRVVQNKAESASETVFVPNKFESASEATFDKNVADPVYEQINIDDIAVHSPEGSPRPSNDVQRNVYHDGDVISEDDAVVFIGDLMDTSTESSTTYSEDNADIDTDDEQQNVDEPVQFIVDQVFDHLKGTLLPETWCWVTNPKDENSIIFVQINRHTLNIRLRLVLYNDLSVTAQTADEKTSVQLESTVTSVRMLETLLEDMGVKILCGGSGMEEQSRDADCPSFIGPGEYDRFVPTPRCSFCRKLRRKLQNRNNRNKTDWKVRYARSKRTSDTRQRTCKRLQEKVSKQKQRYKSNPA